MKSIKSIKTILVVLILVTGLTPSLAQQQPASYRYGSQQEKKEQPEQQLQKGLEYLQEGKLKMAVAAFDAALEQRPAFAEAHYALGLARERQQNDPAAMLAYETALRLQPRHTEARFNLALLHHRNQRYEQAIEELDNLLQTAAMPTQTAFYSMETTPGGDSLVTGITTLNNRKDLLHYHKALALRDSGNAAEAMNSIDKALEIKPESTTYLNFKGLLLHNEGKGEAAIELLKMALLAKPGDVETAYNLTLVTASALENTDAAIAAYNLVLANDSAFIPAYINRGILKYEKGDYTGAVEDYDFAIRLDSTLLNAHINKGMALNKAGQYDAAIASFNQALELEPGLSSLYTHRGNSQLLARRYREAVQDYTKALELDPEIPNSYFNRGVAYINLGNHEAACPDLQKAAEGGLLQARKLLEQYCQQQPGEEE